MAENEVKVETDDRKPWYAQLGELARRASGPIGIGQGVGAGIGRLGQQFGEARRRREEEGITQAPTVPAPDVWGLPAVEQFFQDRQAGLQRDILNATDWLGAFFEGEKPDVLAGDIAFPRYAPELTEAEIAYGPGGDPTTNPRVQQFYANREGRLAQAAEAERQAAEAERLANQPTFEEFLGEYQFDGTPYDEAANYMQERREAQMRAIQDMYNEYAAETQANVDRIGDIYGGAEAGIGETYAGATGNIEDAYASAQQQAADQMARLGIEEAAPAVLDPMALSQAETLSNLETGRASSLGATQQFGATAGGFATDMATIAQQQALENQRSLTDQLADQLFEIEMQRMQAQQAYNPYQRAMQELETRQAFENFYNPQVDPLEQQQMMMDLAGIARENQAALREEYYRALEAGIESGLYENTPEGREQAWQDTMAAWQRAESVFPIG